MSLLALLSIPILTGLASVLWAAIAGQNPAAATLLNALSTCIVGLAVLAYSGDGPRALPADLAAIGSWRIALYLVANMAVSLAWVLAQYKAHIAIIGFVEVGYPLFVLLFSVLLLGPLRFTPLHWVGATLIMAGTCCIVWQSLAERLSVNQTHVTRS